MISDIVSIMTNLLFALCLLPKLEYTCSVASSSLAATTSRVYGWSCLPDRNVPVALYAFIARATWGPDLIQADSQWPGYTCSGKIKIGDILHYIMEDSKGGGDSSSGPKYAWFWFLCFLFPPLILLAIPVWLIAALAGEEPPSEPPPEQTEVPEPRIWPTKRPQPEYDVFPVKADYKGPETQWWDVDDVLVGEEHGRPEDEWWAP